MSAVGKSGSLVPNPEASGRDGLEVVWAPPAKLAERLYARAHAEKWQLDAAAFAEALRRSAEHQFSRCEGARGEPFRPPQRTRGPAEVESYLDSLHLEDLALACACAQGNEVAWEHFVREFRPVLYAAARAIAGESAARELADSLYADLFGLSEAEGERKSLFRYFHGRSKLSTWLRAVLAQRYVDVLRAARRTESLDEYETTEDRKKQPRTSRLETASRSIGTPDPERGRYLALLQATLTTALAALEPRDRLRLSYYYVQDLTLAQIGRLLGEHEATVSRKLERTRRALRKEVESALAGDPHRLSEAQLQLCFQYAREEWPFDLTQALSAGTNSPGGEEGK